MSNNTGISYQVVEDLPLSGLVVTDVNVSGGSIQIEVDSELCATSTNPVENKAITKELDQKLNYDEYIVDLNLNPNSSYPVQNKAIYNTLNRLTDRVTQLEYLNNVRLAYVTNLEVFPTLNDISAGTVSEKTALIERMFKDTNKWNSTTTYPAGTIVTSYNSESNIAKIYKSISDNTGTKLSNDEVWEDITDTYLYKDEENNVYYHKFIEAVPQSTVQVLIFKSVVRPSEQNTVIKWGYKTDNDLDVETKLQNSEEKSENIELGVDHPVIYEQDENGYIYYCWHDYSTILATEELESNYYTISIIGNKFSSLTSDKAYNIISMFFGDNQQFQLDCFDVEGLLSGSNKLLYINCSDYNSAILQIFNIKSLFEDCKNLQYVVGFYELTGINTMLSMERMFANCINLLNSDVRIAKSLAVSNIDNGNSEVYLNCENMSSSLRLLLPSNGFDSRIITLNSTFKNCKNIHLNSSTDNNEPSDLVHVSNILFNDNSKIFNITKPFENCTVINLIKNGEIDFVPTTTANANGYWK